MAGLNLGGVANITYFGMDNEILAFDCGPGNALMDDFIMARRGEAFDCDGALAAQGKPNSKIVESFLADEYFSLTGPKSLDRNKWGLDWVEGLSDADGMATLVAMTIRALEKSMWLLPEKPKGLYVAGGGRKNKFLMALLGAEPVECLGWNGDATEAEGFAYLAVRSLLGLPLTLPGTTGVKAPLTGGNHYVP